MSRNTRKRQADAVEAIATSCPTCDNLKAKARAIRAAEKRMLNADPACPCHNYRRSACIAPSSEAWWTQERIAEYHDAKDAFDVAEAEFDAAMVAFSESVR